MAGQNGGIGARLHAVFMLLWVFVTIIFFASMVVIAAPFNRRLARIIGNTWINLFLVMAGIKVEVKGLEKLEKQKRYVFVANHQSQLDIPVLMGGLRHHLSFIAKKELFKIPFFGWGIYAQGHIWIDRGNARKAHKSIQRAIGRLKKDNVSLALFPEGTRSKNGKVGKFKQGSFSLVQQAGVEVVPVAIHNTSLLLAKHSLSVRKGTVTLTVCDPVTIDDAMSKAEISERLRQTIVEVLGE
ncbi:MAG: 1-acyl-sn-glycerol-3-phosphate acyltransferase [Chitinispirillaceae bacterium]|nr:1-acyl-sn-glycerol-3-phosphate acyltransferase [Chitinispirillaceae bacterium]